MRPAPVRSARRGAASARPMRTRSGGARSGSVTSGICPNSTHCSTGCVPITTRFEPGSRSRRSTAIDCAATSPRSPISCFRTPGRCGATSTRHCGAVHGSCSKARKAFCSTSTTAPIRSSPPQTPSPGRPGRAAASARPPPVGSGPFPTELDDETGQKLGERGHEFGTVTGRRRRCGWFDAVLVRQAVAVSGITGVALTKLDVLDGFDTVRICTGYRIGGEAYDYLPPHAFDQDRVEPVYEEIEGWPGSTRGARSWADLPARAIKYVRRIEELIRCPVALVSTSPERDDTILVRDPFAG